MGFLSIMEFHNFVLCWWLCFDRTPRREVLALFFGGIMEWIIDGEDVLLQCHATFNKQGGNCFSGHTQNSQVFKGGTFFVTNKRVAFSQNSARSPSISLPVAFLKGNPRRNKGGEQCLLKFVLKQAVKELTDFTFNFTAPSKVTDRDSVLEVVTQLLNSVEKSELKAKEEKEQPAVDPLAKRKKETRTQKAVREAEQGLSGGDVRRKATALAGDPALRALYDELVKPGVISEEEFWHNRQSDLDKYKAATSSLVTGNPS